MKDKVLLIFPPVWLPDVPFLSTPALTAFLKQNAIDAEQMDVNIQFWKYLYSSQFVRNIHHKVIKRFKILHDKKLTLSEQNEFKKIAIIGKLSETQFVEEVQQKIIPDEIFLEIVGNYSEFKNNKFLNKTIKIQKNTNIDEYHDLFYNSISYSTLSYSIADLTNIIISKKNPYIKFYNKNVVGIIIKREPKIIGISITANNQVIPAFSLAKIIKDTLPDSIIVIGGSWCSLINGSLGKKLHLFSYIDYMIVNEGEKPLLDLANSIFKKENKSKLQGVYYKHGSSVEYTNSTEFINMSELPTPNFEGINLNDYLQRNTLPIQIARGCYWGKCIFCSYPILERKYKIRDTKLIINDIIQLQSKYKTKIFSIVDSLISPAFAYDFCNLILENKLKFEWVMFARFEKQFTEKLLKKMSDSGCTTICWGLESGNKRVLQEIKKNIDLSNVKDILHNSSSSEIHNRVLVMYGLPSEQLSEAYDTINFIKENINNIHSLGYNFYHPEKNTPIEEYFLKNGIGLIEEHTKDLSFGYKSVSLLGKENSIRIKHEYKMLENLIEKRKEVDSININQLVNSFKNEYIETKIPSVNNLTALSVLCKQSDGLIKRYFFETIKY